MEKQSPPIESIYKKYYLDIYHFALYFTNNKQEAEDITQETFIKVMKNFHQLKNQTKEKVWIFSIAKNTAIDLVRKKRFTRLMPEFLKNKESNDETFDHTLIRKENWYLLQQALLRLKPKYRSIVILRGLKELSIKETADILGYSELKVRVDYHRAIVQIKEYIHFEEKGGNLNESAK